MEKSPPPPLHDKTVNKLGIEGNNFNLIKGSYEKPTASLLCKVVSEGLPGAFRQKKKSKHPEWKRRSKTISVCR